MLSASCRPRAGTSITSNALLRNLSSGLGRTGRPARAIANSPRRPAQTTTRRAHANAFEELPWMQQFKQSLGSGDRTTTSVNAIIQGHAIGKPIRVSGTLGNARSVSKKMIFVPLSSRNCSVQLISLHDHSPTSHETLRGLRANSPVEVSGTLQLKNAKRPKDGELAPPKEYEILVTGVKCLNDFPADILVGEDATYGPEQRHLQIRFDEDLKKRLVFRSKLLKRIRTALSDFHEIETPILFKSTPEGAREFLVPSRTPGLAYALPQSPQQYKQILMASGMERYFQVARCFRDEDLRADRQPEFTQLDMEMAFANGNSVMHRMEHFISDIWTLRREWEQSDEEMPVAPFRRMKYEHAMTYHGVDKPDLRIKDHIHRVESLISPALKGMITSIENPIVELFKINLNCSPEKVRAFVKTVMDSPEMRPFHKNPDGGPGVFIYDPSKPLEGLQAFGFESVDKLKGLYSKYMQVIANQTETTAIREARAKDRARDKAARARANQFPKNDQGPTYESPENAESPIEIPIQREPMEAGDLLILQARPQGRLSGGSTALGRLRTHIHKSAVAAGLIPQDPSFEFLWITHFPLFTPTNDVDPGQGGAAGFSATHHPFTSPRTAADVDLLLTDPLSARADHFDLVLNGVELGGGSGRIHNAEMQKWIMREILRMPEARIADFDHLFEALRAGCPPHAGMALGLDRLVAVMTGTESIRDVIAFPKNNRGEDMLVGSPTVMTEGQQATYHLRVVDKEKKAEGGEKK